MAPVSLEDLFARYDVKIRKFLGTVTNLSPSDLEEAAQDVYVRFAKYDLLDRYRADRAAFDSFLFLVCSSVARNRHRTRLRRPKCVGWEPNDLRFTRSVARTRPRQEVELLGKEIRAYLDREHPHLLAVLNKFEASGRIKPEKLRALRDAIAPILATHAPA